MKTEEQFTSILNSHKAKLKEELVEAKTGFADGMLKKKTCLDDMFGAAHNARNVDIIEEKLKLISKIEADFAEVLNAEET
jgi:hypothetical protein